MVDIVAHELKEEVLILEVVVAAHMHDVKIREESLAQLGGLLAVFGKALVDEPLDEVLRHKALLVRLEAVFAISDVEGNVGAHGDVA